MRVEFKNLHLALILTAVTALAACHKDQAPPPPAAEPTPAATPAPSTDSAPASSSSVGGAIDDTAITAKVKAALLAESSIKGDVDVVTNQGVVILSGAVESADQGAKAEQIAKATAGVTGVNNQLTVKK